VASKLRVILGIHCHQPVGNFDHVFEHGYQVSYKPFLETLARFPALKVSLHYSGPLLEWLSERHPEFFHLISELLKKGQLEIIGGGYYEPILPVIPREDSLGQLRYMSRYLAKHFGVKVRGAWLTERIWEPGLPGLLAEAGEQRSDQSGHASIHERQFSEKPPRDVFVYDPYPRWMFREHFLERAPQDFQEASRGEPAELGDFADGSWNWRLLVRKGVQAACALNRSGQLRLPSGQCAAFRLGKRISLEAGSRLIEAAYRLENLEEQPLEFVFGISFNLTVLGPADPKVGLICEHGSAMSLAQGSILPACKQLTVFNHRENVNLRLGFSLRPSCVVQYPVETVSQSESGIDRTYQATCLLPLWPVKLKPLSSKSLKLTLTIFQ
jgi:hypothetical protein